MAMTRRMMALKRDVKNPKVRRGGRHGLDSERTIPADARFVHEIVTARFTGEVLSDLVIHLADDLSPEETFESGTPLYKVLMAALKRVPPSPERILIEMNVWLVESLWTFLSFLIETGACDLEGIERAALAYRQSVDYDMQDEDDTIDVESLGS